MRVSSVVAVVVGVLCCVVAAHDVARSDVRFSVEFGENVGEKALVLECLTGQGFVDCVNTFIQQHGIPPSNLDVLVKALVSRDIPAPEEPAPAAPAAATQEKQNVGANGAGLAPLFTLDVDIPGRGTVAMPYFDGHKPGDAARMFLNAFGVGEEAFAEALVGRITYAIVEKLGSDIQVVVMVNVGQGATIPLIVRHGVDPSAAVSAFMGQHNIPETSRALLEDAVTAKLEVRATQEPLFTLPITIDGVQKQVSLYKGEAPDSVAKEFIVMNRLSAHPEAAAMTANVQAALEKRLNTPEELTPAEQEAQQAAAAAAAKEQMEANQAHLAQATPEPEWREMHLIVLGTAYDLEYPVGEDVDLLAEVFCEQEIDLLRPQMAAELKVDADSLGVQDCARLVVELMKTSLELEKVKTREDL